MKKEIEREHYDISFWVYPKSQTKKGEPQKVLKKEGEPRKVLKKEGKPQITLMEAEVGARSILDMIDNFDRPARTYADGLYSDANTYAYAPTNKPGQRIPKAGAIAGAGVGRVGAEFSIFQVGAKGPNAIAEAKADIVSASAMARAEVGSASASVGPVGVTVGLGVDTGVRVGLAYAEVKFLGCGIKFGYTMGISLFGSEISFKLQ